MDIVPKDNGSRPYTKLDIEGMPSGQLLWKESARLAVIPVSPSDSSWTSGKEFNRIRHEGPLFK